MKRNLDVPMIRQVKQYPRDVLLSVLLNKLQVSGTLSLAKKLVDMTLEENYQSLLDELEETASSVVRSR